MLSHSGMLHVIHNTANDVLEATKVGKEPIDQLAEVMKFTSTDFTRDRMLELCFDDGVGRMMHKDVKAIHGKLYRKRWGSVAFCTHTISEKTFIRSRWNLAKYC